MERLLHQEDSGYKRSRSFKHVLIEEAGQVTEPQCLFALSLLQEGGCCTLCGGSYAAVCANRAIEELLQCSLMERLMVKEGLDSVLLDIQYRMVSPIARWPSEEFYDSRLRTAARLKAPREPPEGFP